MRRGGGLRGRDGLLDEDWRDGCEWVGGGGGGGGGEGGEAGYVVEVCEGAEGDWGG